VAPLFGSAFGFARRVEETTVMSDAEIADYVREHAPELEAKDVIAFMRDHAKPDDETGSQLAWAVSLLRQRGENETGGGLSVDRVADELRRRDA
jgi:hypothetical protein